MHVPRIQSLRHTLPGASHSRSLRVESLEDRRMLAVFMVDNLNDAGADSLRDAVAMANSMAGADEIQFSVAGSIGLTSGEITITDALTITGPGQDLLTVDASNASRIFNITAPSGDFTIAGLTLTGGQTTGDNANLADTTHNGGAVRSLTSGSLTIDQSTVSGNSTTGYGAYGGGLFSSGALTLTNSTVSNNSTAGTFARGGGIDSRGAVTLTDSTISGNNTAGLGADGGGISSHGDVTLIGSTISANFTTADSADGGGVFSLSGAVTLTNSTVSGNHTAGDSADGGGIYSKGAVTLRHSTIADNHANHANAFGGGIWNDNDAVTIDHTIVAENTAGGGGPDLRPGTGALDVAFSLIGDKSGTTLTEAQVPDGDGNLIGDAGGAGVIDPLLGPLVDNGGAILPNGAATLTHALLFGSPAIDAGDLAAAPGDLGVPVYDQRGNDYGRVHNGRIDMGAFEVRKISPANFNGDSSSVVNGRDFLAWQRGFGTPAATATRLDGDADNDLDVDGADLSLWQDQYGQLVYALLGVPTEIDFGASVTVNTVLVTSNNQWLGQGEYYFAIEIEGVNGGFQHHGTQLVAVDDATVFIGDDLISTLIVDWTTDNVPRHVNERYTVSVQVLRFLGNDGTFELFGNLDFADFGPF